MDATEREYLRAILRAPGNDDARRVYADWLTERGDPRGEYINAACRARDAASPSDREAAQRLADDLLSEHRAAWLEALGVDEGTYPYPRVTFSRGFLSGLEIDAGPWLELGPTLTSRTPLESLALRDVRREHLAALAGARWMRRVRALRLANNELTTADVEVVAQGAALARLRRLDLAANRLTGGAARALAGATFRLRALDLSRNDVGDGAVAELARAAAFAGLRELGLYRCGLTSRGVASLVAAPWFSALRSLALYGNDIDAEGDALLRERGYVVAFWQLAGAATPT